MEKPFSLIDCAKYDKAEEVAIQANRKNCNTNYLYAYEAAHSCVQPKNVPNEFIDFEKNDAMES